MTKHHVGYFAVIIPEYEFYQAYFIDDRFADIAKDAMVELRRGLAPDMEGVVVEASEGILPENTEIVGGLCGALVEDVIRDHEGGTRVAVFGYCIMLATHWPYFAIIAEPGEKGHRTRIEQLGVASEEAARDAINRHPLVQPIQLKLVRQAWGLARNRNRH